MIKIADFLHPEDFFVDSHGKIYGVMAELFHAHKPIDMVTVTSQLKDQGVLSAVGGAAKLAEFSSRVPSATHIFEYAQIVKKKSTLRGMLRAGDKIMHLGQEEDKKVEDLLESAEKEVFSISQTFIRDRFVSIKEILAERYEIFAERHMQEGEVEQGISTGFVNLDKYIGGWQSGDMVVIAARPSMGKTALALSFSMKAALNAGKRVGIFSLEMGKDQLVDRMFASHLGVDSWKLSKGKLDDHDFARMGVAMDELSKAPIYIDDASGSTMSELRAKARRLQMEHGLDMIIVDYLQLISTGNNAYAGNRVQEISEISRSFKQLARELNVPVIALSQLSRAVEQRPNKEPVLSDLRESGAIEQDADIVLMMYRDEYYDSDTDRKGITDIFIRKHRNGPVGQAELGFDLSKMKFVDIDTSRSEEW